MTWKSHSHVSIYALNSFRSLRQLLGFVSYQPLKVVPKRGKAVLVRPEEQRQLDEPETDWQQTEFVHFPMFQ